jgi:glycosyltransferase involved in cell wall biosynthesis
MSLVSVLMPMRNAEPYVRESLESLLSQNADLEVVVIDDGSTDRSAAVVKGIGDPRIRLLPGPRQGISAAVNAALAAARGDLVARCDADDLFPPGRLAWQMKWLARHPEVGAVCGRFTTITDAGATVGEFHCDSGQFLDVTDELREGKTRTHLGTFTIRTEALRKIGGCRPFFQTAEDIDLQMRLAGVCRVWFVPEVFYLYRLHPNSITHTQKSALRRFFEETAREFASQRRAGQPDDLERGCPPTPPMPEMTGSVAKPQLMIQGVLLSKAWAEHAEGRKLTALRTGLRACRMWPRNWGAWRSLAMLALKPARKR